jgi:hypothetical protein
LSQLKAQRAEQAQEAAAFRLEEQAYREGMARLRASQTHSGPKPGQVTLLHTQKTIDEVQLHNLLGPDAKKSAFFTYKFYGVEQATGSAMGLDKRHHFVNGYLEGFSPFTTTNVFVPLSVLARKKRYMLDKLNHGDEEIWQTSRQAYVYTRGDCEDHAIALADWLIDMGEDARVALGTYDGGGHAWVVLIKDNREYILEATQKNGLSGLRRYPLASTQPLYRPQFQFNRTSFWFNVGTTYTTDYRSSAWLEKSHYASLQH